MPTITRLNLSFDPAASRGVITFTINWSADDGPVGTPWDMLIEFIGSDEGEPLHGSNDLLARLGFVTRVLSTPTDARTIGFSARSGALNEDVPIALPFPPFVDTGRDEVFVEVSLLPVPRSSGARARSNTIRGHF